MTIFHTILLFNPFKETKENLSKVSLSSPLHQEECDPIGPNIASTVFSYLSPVIWGKLVGKLD